MRLFLQWALLCLSAFAVLTAVRFPLRNKFKKTVSKLALDAAELVIATVFAVIVMAGPVFFRPLQPLMFALYAVLFADGVAALVYTVFCSVAKKEQRFAVAEILSAVFCILFIVYGTVNMQLINVKYHTYKSKKISSEHTFVYLADLHTGSAQNFSTAKKAVDEIKSSSAEFIVLCGDITDDYTTKDEMLNTFALFKDFGKPVYYVYGNHDRQGYAEYAHGRQYTPEELENAIISNGITILKDEFARINSEIIILGREDYSEKEGRADIAGLTNPDPSSYLIVADHQPNGFKEHASFGADLQISGHTHAGQLFPLGLFYSIAAPVYGDYEEQGAVMNITSGACGWRMPFRTSAHCNYEVITLQPVE
ncbi:MAG: metallophosphoesterase [Clostridia bacterium]|nr:metallophosphoesterase [Clostridia bacterium]